MIAYNFGAGAAGCPVPDWELLGRGIFSSRQAKWCRSNDGVPALVFREADGVRTLSVDRLSVAPEAEAIMVSAWLPHGERGIVFTDGRQ